MATYDLREFNLDFVVHYSCDERKIDAFTFGNSLVSLRNALQAINKEANPEFAIEVSASAIGSGNFRPAIIAKAKIIGTLIFGDFRQGIVTALAAVLIARLLGDEKEPRIEIEAEDVEIHYYDGNAIILPKDAYEIYNKSKDNPDLDRAITQSFEILKEDEAINNFGFARSAQEVENIPFQIPRTDFPSVARPQIVLAENQRELIIEDAALQIVRAIFKDSTRALSREIESSLSFRMLPAGLM